MISEWVSEVKRSILAGSLTVYFQQPKSKRFVRPPPPPLWDDGPFCFYEIYMSQMIKLRVTVASGRVFKIPLKSDGSVGDLREVVKRRSLVGVDDEFDLCSEGDVLCDEDKVLDIV